MFFVDYSLVGSPQHDGTSVCIYDRRRFCLGGVVMRILDRGRAVEYSTILITLSMSFLMLSGIELGLVASASEYSA